MPLASLPIMMPCFGKRELRWRTRPRPGFRPPVRIELLQQNAEALGDDALAARRSRRQFTADEGNASLGRKHVDAGQLHHFGNGAARRRAQFLPHAVQSMAMARVAGRVVRKLEVILHSRSLAEL